MYANGQKRIADYTQRSPSTFLVVEVDKQRRGKEMEMEVRIWWVSCHDGCLEQEQGSERLIPVRPRNCVNINKREPSRVLPYPSPSLDTCPAGTKPLTKPLGWANIEPTMEPTLAYCVPTHPIPFIPSSLLP